jgi:hypothetical protein
MTSFVTLKGVMKRLVIPWCTSGLVEVKDNDEEISISIDDDYHGYKKI